jgi:Protein of unknown function (DUF3037)
MMTAYYSLLQFIPDLRRDERVNVGLVMQAPEYNYAAMDYRRYMDGQVRALQPHADATIIRLLAQSLCSQFEPFSKEPLVYQQVLLETPETSPTSPKYLDSLISPYTSIYFTKPKPFLVSESRGFARTFELLCGQLLQAPKQRVETSFVTKEILKHRVMKLLENRKMQVRIDPPPIRGLHFRNEFDALRDATGLRQHIQFLSFELKESPVLQAKSLLASVSDVRQSQDYQDDLFYCILQPPILNRKNAEDYESTLLAFRKSGIERLQVSDDGREIVEGLHIKSAA